MCYLIFGDAHVRGREGGPIAGMFGAWLVLLPPRRRAATTLYKRRGCGSTVPGGRLRAVLRELGPRPLSEAEDDRPSTVLRPRWQPARHAGIPSLGTPGKFRNSPRRGARRRASPAPSPGRGALSPTIIDPGRALRADARGKGVRDYRVGHFSKAGGSRRPGVFCWSAALGCGHTRPRGAARAF